MLAQIVNKTVRQFIFCIQVFNRDVGMGGGDCKHKNSTILLKCPETLFAIKGKVQNLF